MDNASKERSHEARKEALAALCVAASAAFLLCGYEFMRSISQSLFIGAYGAANLPVVMALAPIGTLALIYLYGRVLSVVGPKRAILLTHLFSGLGIMGGYVAVQGGSRLATGWLYVFREAYIVLLVEQIWSFINSTLNASSGRRLNGPICGIASLGAISGGLLVKAWATEYGSANLLAFAAFSLIPAGALAALAYHVGAEPQPAPEEAAGRQGHLGLRVLLREPALRDLALLIAVTQVVSTAVDLQLSRYVEQAIPLRDERTRWFGGFYAQLNGGAFVFQFLLTPLLLRWVPVRLVHILIPLVHLGFCGWTLLHPSLAAAASAYLAFKILDYSVFRAAKEIIYIPLSFDARYRAKEMIDAFVYRFAKGGASAALAVTGRVAPLALDVFPRLSLAALLAWLPLSVLVGRAARDGQSAAPLHPRLQRRCETERQDMG